MKGYHSDRVNQTFDTVTSRRNLIRAALIGIPALVLASASAGTRQDSAPHEKAASVTGETPFDGQSDADGREFHVSGIGSAGV